MAETKSYEILVKIDDDLDLGNVGVTPEEREHARKLYEKRAKELNLKDPLSNEEIAEKKDEETRGSLSAKIQKGIGIGLAASTLATNLATQAISVNAEMRGDVHYAQRIKAIQGNINTGLGLVGTAVAIGYATNVYMAIAAAALQTGIKAIQYAQQLKQYLDQVASQNYVNQLDARTLARDILGERYVNNY